MKTITELNIKDWNGYFFEEMVNILILALYVLWLVILKNVQMVQWYTIFVILIKLVYHILFLII